MVSLRGCSREKGRAAACNEFFPHTGVAALLGSDTGTDFVVAYARASTPVRCFNYISLMYGSSFVGHQSCNSDGDTNA